MIATARTATARSTGSKFIARTSTIVSARRKPGAEGTIVGQVLTMTAKGQRKVGFSAKADDAAALLGLVGKTVDLESSYCGPSVLVIVGVLPAAGEPIDARSVEPEHVTEASVDVIETSVSPASSGEDTTLSIGAQMPALSWISAPADTTIDAWMTGDADFVAGCSINKDGAAYTVRHHRSGHIEAGFATMVEATAAAKDISRAVSGQFRA